MVNTVKFSQFQQVDLANATNEVVGVSSPSGGHNFQTAYPLSWDASTQPVTPKAGTLGYNSSLGQYEFWNGIAWVQVAAGGSGSVNVGAANEIAYYPANGTAVSGLLSINDAILTTTALGIPLFVTATGTGLPVRNNSPTLITPVIGAASATSIEFSSTTGVIGTTTNDNAAVGSVGELISSVIPFSSSVSLTTNVIDNLTSIILHEGDYDVWANINFSASVGLSSYSAWTNILSTTQPDASLYSIVTTISAITSNASLNTPMVRMSIAAPTTVYLSAKTLFASGTASMCGAIYARVRR